MNKLKELEKEIKKQIPSIMDLKFGCEFSLIGCKPENVIADLGWYKYIRENTFIPLSNKHYNNPQGKVITDNRVGSEIRIYGKNIGRPITLEDVLRLLSNIPLLEIEFHGDCKLKFRLGFGVVKEPTNWVFWDLEKPLSQQKPETINFLYELICKNILENQYGNK